MKPKANNFEHILWARKERHESPENYQMTDYVKLGVKRRAGGPVENVFIPFSRFCWAASLIAQQTKREHDAAVLNLQNVKGITAGVE